MNPPTLGESRGTEGLGMGDINFFVDRNKTWMFETRIYYSSPNGLRKTENRKDTNRDETLDIVKHTTKF